MRKKTPRPEKMITTEQSQNNKSDILLMSDGISLSTDDEEGEEAAKDKMLEKHKVRNVAFRRSNIGIAVQWWSAWLNIWRSKRSSPSHADAHCENKLLT